MQVNYIKHLESIHSKFIEDNRINPFHISLYMALFHLWNSAMFPEHLSIARTEVMRFSKLGSVNTYTKCLKQLHAFGYIEYLPSKNPYVGSLINMYRSDNSSSNSSDHSMCLKTDNSCDNTSEIHVRPYINYLNNNKQLNNINFLGVDLKKIDQPTISKCEDEFSSSDEKAKKVAKKENPIENPKKTKPIVALPTMDQVTAFFQEKNRSELEAQKFFNHFESNGWLVGGKAKMKNWHAAARNWILNSDKFQSGIQQKKPGDIAVNQNKDYSVPL